METKETYIKDLKKNDRIKGVCATLQVISNKNGLLKLYNERTGEFFDADYRRFVKRNAKVETY